MVECLSGDRWHAKRLLVLRLLLHTDCTIETHSIDPTFMPARVATITKIHITATDRGTSPSPGRLPYHYGFSIVLMTVCPAQPTTPLRTCTANLVTVTLPAGLMLREALTVAWQRSGYKLGVPVRLRRSPVHWCYQKLVMKVLCTRIYRFRLDQS